MCFTRRLVALMSAASWASAACAAVIVWSEDFSDVSDWQIISDPGGGSSITSDGDLGALYVNDHNNLAAFGPKTDGSAPLLRFRPEQASLYTMHFTVDSITWSLSYDIALDLFGPSTNYLDTVWQVFPSESTSTFVGYTNVNLGGFSYHTSTYYVLPKITVHTGDGGQTAHFDELHFDEEHVPEPAPAVLLAAATLFLLGHRRPRAGRL